MAMINIIWLPPNGPLIQQNVGYFWGWCAQALDYTGLQTSVAAPDPTKGLCARSQVGELLPGAVLALRRGGRRETVINLFFL